MIILALITGDQVRRPIEQIDREETNALNIAGVYGRSEQFQSEAWSYTATADDTHVIDQDVIITGIATSVRCADSTGSSNASAYITIKGTQIRGAMVEGDDSTGVAQTLFIPIPNWLLRAGEEITVNISTSDGTASVSIIGYYA